MNFELEQVAHLLDEAFTSMSVGQVELACTNLDQAAGILDTLTAALIPNTPVEPEQVEEPRAMALAMAA
jgi:hypothetical protein